jgi:hypothetical protein
LERCRRVAASERIRFGDEKDIDDLKNADRIDYKESNEPNFLAAPRGKPQRETFPQQAPRKKKEHERSERERTEAAECCPERLHVFHMTLRIPRKKCQGNKIVCAQFLAKSPFFGDFWQKNIFSDLNSMSFLGPRSRTPLRFLTNA